MSEMTLTEACSETRKFGRILKGLDRLAEVANALESADQAVTDRRREEAQVLAAIAAGKSELEALTTKLAEARDAARTTTEAASERAGTTIADANRQAEKIIADANAALERLKDDTQSLIVRQQIAEKARRDAEAELATLNGKIEMAKLEARKIIGA